MGKVKMVFHDATSSIESININTIKQKIKLQEDQPVLQFAEHTTIQELLEESHPFADLSLYYSLSKAFCFNEHFFPYIVTKNNELIWNVAYKDARVIDFFNTHQIVDGIIFAEIGIVQAGGIGLKEIVELWRESQVFYYNIAVYITICSVVPKIINTIKGFFINRGIPPQSVFDFIYSKDEWNHHELSEYLGIDKQHTKDILNGLGYEWNNSRKTYVKQSIAFEIQDKFSKVNMLPE